MLPEQTRSIGQRRPLLANLPGSWRGALPRLALAWAAITSVTLREWGEMLHQWWSIDTYAHIVLIPPVIAWLVLLRREQLVQLDPRSWLPGLAVLALALGLWLAGRASGVNLLAQAGAVAALQAAVLAMLGPRVAAALLLPLGFMVFLVPFGDEIIPALQAITARIAIALTLWSGVPATIEGIHIATPVGLFIVAEACSGVKFLIAMVALGVLVCFTAFASWKRRVLFMLACVVVPVIANGVRAWGTIYLAQSLGVEFAAGFDHIFYGWIFFAIIVAGLLGAAWPLFERDAEEAGFTLETLRDNRWIDRAEALRAWPVATTGGLAVLLGAFHLAAIVLPPALG